MEELKSRVNYFRDENKLIEAQRIEERTRFDMEMIQELGYCNGIENYSRHLTGRQAGEPPPTLLDYFPPDYLLFVDESHIACPKSGPCTKATDLEKRLWSPTVFDCLLRWTTVPFGLMSGATG